MCVLHNTPHGKCANFTRVHHKTAPSLVNQAYDFCSAENFQHLNNTMWNETSKYVEYGRRLKVAEEKDLGFLTKVESALFYYMFTPRLVFFAQMFIESGYELRFCGGTVR